MELFIGNLSANTRKNDLFIFLGRYGKQADVSMRKLKFETSVYYYAHINIDSEKQALKVIKKLHGKRINGKPVLIREFEYRAGNNDRRGLNWRNLLWDNSERRLNERRQCARIFERKEPEFTGYNNLVKKG